jgi:hypothetical protein
MREIEDDLISNNFTTACHFTLPVKEILRHHIRSTLLWVEAVQIAEASNAVIAQFREKDVDIFDLL